MIPNPSSPMDDINRIVILRASQLGDFLVATPAFRALRAAFPGAQISLIGLPRVRPVLDRFPHYIDRLLPFPGYPGIRDAPVDPRRTLSFLEWAQKERFDLALQMQGSGVFTNPFIALLGARITAGFIREEDDPPTMGLDHHVPYRAGQHQVLRLLELLHEIGVPARGHHLEFPVVPADHLALDALLRERGVPPAARLIGVHPGARFENRRWPAENFARAATRLARDLNGTIMVTGSEEERPITTRVMQALSGPAVDLTGRLSLGTLAALLTRVTLFLTNDTGPAHLAYALGTPSVTIFGGALPEEWGALDPLRHRVVSAPDPCRPCTGEGCIGRVRLADVLAAAEALLDDQALPAG